MMEKLLIINTGGTFNKRYNPLKGESIYLTEGAIRTDLSQSLVLPNSYSGEEVHLFISFMSADETQLSNSTYIGFGTAA